MTPTVGDILFVDTNVLFIPTLVIDLVAVTNGAVGR